MCSTTVATPSCSGVIQPTGSAITEAPPTMEAMGQTFLCSLCDAVILYDGNKETVIKHIMEYHPGPEIIQEVEECAEIAYAGTSYTCSDV